MKYILLPLLLALASCQPNQNRVLSEVRDAIHAYNDTVLKDPKSYEEISLKVVDTISMREFWTDQRGIWQKYLDEDLKTLVTHKKAALLGIPGSQEVLDQHVEGIDFQKRQIDTINIRLDTLTDGVLYYMFAHKYRAKNSFGGYDIYENTIQYDPYEKIDSLKFAIIENEED